MNTTIRIMRLYAPFKRQLLTSFALLMCIELIGIVTPYLYGQMINVADAHKLSLIAWVGVAYALAMFTSRAVSWVRERFMLALDIKTDLHVSMHTMEKMLSYSIGQHNNRNSGIKQQIINRGQQAIQEATGRTLYELAPMIIGGGVSMIALLAYNLEIAHVTIGASVVYVLVTSRAHARFFRLIRDLRKKNREASKLSSELVRNVELVKLNAREEYAKSEYRKMLMETNDLEMHTWTKVVRYWFMTSLITLAATAVNLIVCALMVYNDQITVGAMVTCLGWSGPILMRVNNIGSIQRAIMNWHVDIDRYFKMTDVPCDITVIDNPVRPAEYRGRIEFENVTFAYPRAPWTDGDDHEGTVGCGEDEQLHDAVAGLSFVLEAGKRYAIVGESGSGKSTFAHLALRSYDPQQGRVLIDGIDLRTLDLTHYLKQVGVVSQETMLFDRTLRENIIWARDEALPSLTEGETYDICQQACIDRFFDRLHKGLDTMIGERGVKLSGGERQRVGIARALAKAPAILIFDEATSHLDAVNEADITSAIEIASAGKTTIIIAHRLSTILSADKILVLDQGRLVGMGTHQELYAGCSPYRDLVGQQMRALEELYQGAVDFAVDRQQAQAALST